MQKFLSPVIAFSYKNILKPLLFTQDPEDVHDALTFMGEGLGKSKILRALTKKIFFYENPILTQKVKGIEFKNPVGLSAGFDKDASLVNIMPSVGFGFMQVGSVTNEAYEGNLKPRLFRLKKSKGIVVYYGLKNIGAKKIIKRLKKIKKSNFPVGISIAKTNSVKTNTVSAGITDYYECLREFVLNGIGDSYTINISCPNTFGGEPFTTPEELDLLFKKLSTVKTEKPIYIKMPINLPWNDFRKLIKILIKYKIAGVEIGNLNKDRNDAAIIDKIPERIKGNISGKPTWKLSNDLIAKTYKEFGDKLIIIGVGGIFSAKDAYEKIKLGSTLTMLITGMIFEGPQLIGEINRELVKLLKKDGYSSISDAIGEYHKK